MEKFIGHACLLLIILTIGAGITGYVTGEIHYVETYRAPGESRGYIGRQAKHLDSEENFMAVFDELASLPAFEGKEDSSIGISLSLGTIYFEEDLILYTPPQLRGSATGVREDLHTKVDLTASQYDMIME